MKNILLALAFSAIPFSAFATTADDVSFAQRQCQQRGDPDKCATYRSIANAYQRESRNVMEYQAATNARKPMSGAYYNDYQRNIYRGDNKGGYRWNSSRGKYCYHNSSGSVNRCVN